MNVMQCDWIECKETEGVERFTLRSSQGRVVSYDLCPKHQWRLLKRLLESPMMEQTAVVHLSSQCRQPDEIQPLEAT